MAKDYVVKLNGDSKGLESTIKSAKKSFQDLNGTADKLSTIKDRFNTITNSSAPLAKKIRDIRKSLEEMSTAGTDTTEAGKQMWEELSAKAKEYDAQLKKIRESTQSVGSASSSVGGSSSSSGAEGALDKITDLTDIANGKLGELGNVARSIGINSAAFDGVSKGLGSVAALATPATAAVAATAGVMVMAGKAAADFETHLDGLQSLTGLGDDAMKAISDGAIEMSKNFKSSASDIVDAMKLIGSQSPELLSDKDALMEVTKSANVLAEAAQIGVVDAAKGITTVMNQMGASATEASNIINVLAAASQQGSADVSYLQTAFEKSGTAAASAGMGYGELAAVIETVAPKFSSADVAGSQLTSTLLKLSTQANDNFKPSVVGMQQALENLSAAQLSDVEITKLVGESNVTMLKTLMQGKDQFASYTQSLQGTNTAFEQMEINNSNMEGAITKLKSAWDAFLITLGQSGLIQGIADNIMLVMEALGEVVNVLSDVINAFGAFETEGIDATTVTKVQIGLLVDIIKGIGTALEIVVRIAAKVFNSIVGVVNDSANWIGERWRKLQQTLGDNAFVKAIVGAFQTVLNAASEMIAKVKQMWNKFLQWLGMEGKSTVEIKPTIKTNTKGTGTADGSTTTTAPTISAGGKGGKSGKGGKKTTTSKTTTKTDKPTAEEGSIKALSDKLAKLNEELNNTKVSDSRLKEILAEKTAIEDQIKQLKIRNGLLQEKTEKKPTELETKRKTYNDANSQLNQTKADFKNGLIDADTAKQQIAEINKQLQSIGLEPLKLNVNVDTSTITTDAEDLKAKLEEQNESWEAYKEQMESVSDLTNTIGGAFGTLGEAIGGTGGAVMSFAGQAAQAAADIIPQVVSLIGAKQAEAMASGTASAAALPFPANLAAMASIIATVVGLFASIPKSFADGGIVGGSSYHGDKVLANLNSGEMILNSGQQASLFRALNNGGAFDNKMGGNVTFTLHGSTLKGALNNFDKKQSRLK